jgi:hypothetical protein
MLKFIPYIFFSALLLNVLPAKAQYGEDSSYITTDTSVQEGSYEDLLKVPEVENEKKAFVFDTITQEDKTVVLERKVDATKLDAIRKDKDFWYVNEAPKREKPKAPEESVLNKLSRQVWFRNLLWFLIVGGFIAVLIWFLLSSNIQLFKKSATAIHKQNDELENKSIFDIDYDNEIKKAIAANDYKMAIRLQYLQVLKEMSDRSIIQYKQERTNSDYLMQLYSTTYYRDFFKLTRVFEYASYGQFTVSSDTYDLVKNDFSTFKQRFL